MTRFLTPRKTSLHSSTIFVGVLLSSLPPFMSILTPTSCLHSTRFFLSGFRVPFGKNSTVIYVVLFIKSVKFSSKILKVKTVLSYSSKRLLRVPFGHFGHS